VRTLFKSDTHTYYVTACQKIVAYFFRGSVAVKYDSMSVRKFSKNFKGHKKNIEENYTTRKSFSVCLLLELWKLCNSQVDKYDTIVCGIRLHNTWASVFFLAVGSFFLHSHLLCCFPRAICIIISVTGSIKDLHFASIHYTTLLYCILLLAIEYGVWGVVKLC
jgi:hypothetical protein